MKATRLPYQQQGVALITVMLIFTIVTVIVTGAVSRGNLDIRRTSYHLNYSQAYQYALGGESLARQWLYEDLMGKDRLPQDHTGEDWYQLREFEPDNGSIRLLIRDQESRFNVNSLIDDAGNIESRALIQLRNLLVELKLSPDIANSLSDWIDKNQIPQTFNSEDTFFLGLSPAYRSADQPITDITEIKAAVNIEPSDWEALMPFLASLPIATPVNPNTASAEVLGSLHPNLDGNKVIKERDSKPEGFTSVEDLLASSSTAGVDLSADSFTVTSEYFEVWTYAAFAERSIFLRSHLHRDRTSGRITILARALMQPPKVIWEQLDPTVEKDPQRSDEQTHWKIDENEHN